MVGQTYSASSLRTAKSWESGGYECVATKGDEEDDIEPFAAVYEHDEQMRKRVYARKKEIFSEVVLASSLKSHPNLAEIIGITQNPLSIVMTFYEGGNLQHFIYSKCRKQQWTDNLTLQSIVLLLQKIADGLSFLHHKNMIVHRDIAARNVLLGRIANDGQIHQNTK